MKEKKLGIVLRMEKVAITPFSVFDRNRYVQHADAGWKREHELRYHTYVILDRCNLKDVGIFS